MARVLAVETATRACSAALWWDGECEETLRLRHNHHAELLIPMARELLARGGCRFDELDALAFGSGPGSFTGLRIGISVVQGLAFGAGRPVVPVSSLLALASRVNASRVLAAIDARMGQVYWNVYRRIDGTMQAVSEPRVTDPGAVKLPDEEQWFAAGSGCEAYRGALPVARGTGLAFVHGVHPHAEDVARIAEAEFSAGRAVAPAKATPQYVRDDVVQARDKS